MREHLYDSASLWHLIMVQQRSMCQHGSVHNWSMMDDLGRGLVDNGIEAMVVIGGVVNGAHRAIGLDQRVLALYDITITLLSLRLDVAGVGILDAIVEGVFGIGHRLRMHSMGQHWRMMHLQQRWGIVSQLNGHSLGGSEEQSDGNKVLHI